MKRIVLYALVILMAISLVVSCDGRTMQVKHVTNLSDINGDDFGYDASATGKSEPIVIDSKDTYYIVDEWQDLWFSGDVTIRNVEFAKGVSFSAQGNEERKITLENCVVRWCDQKNDILPKYVADNNFRIDNSGNGLCLSIDGNIENLVTVEVRNCTFIGDNNPAAERTDSFATSVDYGNYLKMEDKTKFLNYKGRGNGVGLGTASGKGKAFENILIDNCSFEGLRNAAVQLYTFNCPVTISNCDFKSWGINKKDVANEFTTYAIKGDVDANAHDNASLTITNCTFDSSKLNAHCDILNLEEAKIIEK